MNNQIRNQLREIVAEFKDEVLRNLETIRMNEKKIREILNLPVSDDRSINLDYWLQINRILMEKNRIALNSQLVILKYLSTPEIENRKAEAPNLPDEIRELMQVMKPVNRDLFHGHNFVVLKAIKQNQIYNENNETTVIADNHPVIDSYASLTHINNSLELLSKYNFSLN